MSGLIVVGLVLGLGGLVAMAIASVKRRHRERVEAMQAAAERLNLSYEETGSVHEGLSHFHLFSQGDSRRSRHVMRGKTSALDVTIFDHQYSTGSGKNRSTHRLTVVLFEGKQEHIPTFSLRPEHIFHRIGQVFGYQDIDFDTHPGFSKKYLLRGPAEDKVRAVFTPQVLDYFTTAEGAAVEASGGQLVYYPTRKRVKPEELEGLLQDAVRIYALFTV